MFVKFLEFLHTIFFLANNDKFYFSLANLTYFTYLTCLILLLETHTVVIQFKRKNFNISLINMFIVIVSIYTLLKNVELYHIIFSAFIEIIILFFFYTVTNLDLLFLNLIYIELFNI